MANEEKFKISIETEAKGGGAKEASRDIKEVGKSAEATGKGLDDMGKKAKQAEAGAKGAAVGLHEVAEGGGAAEQALTGTADITDALALAMKGDLAGAARLAGGAVEAMTKAIQSSPLGLITVALGVAATAWALLGSKTEEAGEEMDEVSKKLQGLEGPAKETAKKLIEIAAAAVKSAEGMKEEASAVEKVASAFSKAAEEAEHFRKIRDELASAKAGEQIAQVDLAEARGRITPEEAAARRGSIRSQQSAKQAEIAIQEQALLKQRAMQQIRAEEANKQQADSEVFRSKNAFDEATGGRQGPMSPEALAQQQQAAAKKVRDLENAPMVGASSHDPSGKGYQAAKAARDKAIADAKAEAEEVNKLAEAYAKLTEAEAKQKEAQQGLDSAAEKGNKVIDEANQQIALEQSKLRVAQLQSATEKQRTANEQRKAREDAAARAAADAEKAQRDAPKSATPAGDKPGGAADGRAEALAGIDGEAKGAARDLAGVKGRSPEATEKIGRIAKALGDGNTSSGELAAILPALDSLLATMEKAGASKEQEAQVIKQVIQRISTVEKAISRLENGGI